MAMEAGIEKKKRSKMDLPDASWSAAQEPRMAASVSGMAQSIYQQLSALLQPKLVFGVKDLEKVEDRQKALLEGQAGWRELSYAIAKGVIEYMKEEMDISGVRCHGTIVLEPDDLADLQGGGIVTKEFDTEQISENRPVVA